MKIPKILQKNELGFCRIRTKTKKPFEKDWTNKPYTWQDIEEFKDENYGILCGYGNLAVIDCDNKLLQKHIQRFLPKTYQVETGSGGVHYYYFIKGLSKKIILWDKETHLGEVQSSGTQVVGAGSIHPSGKEYKELNQEQITNLDFDVLIDIIKPFMREFNITEESAMWETKETSEIDDLNVGDIWGTVGLKYRNGEYYGSHPTHGSEGGMNFWLNPSKNNWHCFRCDSGGGALSAIAVKEGLINCSEAQRGSLRGAKAFEAINIAKEKYRLKPKLQTKPIANYDVLAESERKDFELLWDKDMEDYKENKQWIIDKLIPSRSVGIWTGKRSTFKTFLVLSAAFSVASGTPFLDKKTSQGTVIYLDKENGIYTMRDRKDMIKKGMGLDDNYNVGFICFSTLKIDNLKDIEKIEKLIEEHKPNLLIIDTYRRGISFEENDAGAVSALFVDILRPLVEKHDFSIILIHHDRKSTGQGDEMEAIRGSSDLANYSDFILKNERKGESKIILKQLKSRSAPEVKPLEITIETDENNYLKFKYEGEYESQTKEDKCVEELLIWITKEDKENFKTIHAKEIAFNKGFKKSNFFNALQSLCDRGIIEKGGRGEYKVLKQQKLSNS